MVSRSRTLTAAIGFAGLIAGGLHTQKRPTAASMDAALASPMLTGMAKAQEGALGGVAVSAREHGRSVTVTVFTDQRGEFVFPELSAGSYQVWAQAVGYDQARADVILDGKGQRRQSFSLRPLEDFSAQLSGAEWMMALPEDTFAHRRMKQIFHNTCTGCHQPHFVLQNRLDEAGWRGVIEAMTTITSSHSWMKNPDPTIVHFKPELAAYLAEMRGPGASPMKFTRLERPSGEAARAVITEYDVPPAETPGQPVAHDGSNWTEGVPSGFYALGLHDIAIDFNGNAWMTFAVANKERTYAKLDTRTGRVTSFKVPGGPGGFLRGSHGITVGTDGIVWLNVFAGEETDAEGTSGVGGLGRLDPKTEQLRIFTPPKGMAGAGGHLEVDGKGKVWVVTNRGALRFDPDTEQFQEFKTILPGDERFGTYGLGADSEGNGWWAVITHDKVGVSDIKTGQASTVSMAAREDMRRLVSAEDKRFYDTFGSASGSSANIGFPWAQAPRRLGGDRGGNVMWVANWWGQNLAEIDIRTRHVTYHDAPIPYSGPYDVEVADDHTPWITLRNSDRVGTFDPKTGQWTVILLPTLGTEARHITIDRRTGAAWLPYSRTSKAARVQMRSEQTIRAAAALVRAR